MYNLIKVNNNNNNNNTQMSNFIKVLRNSSLYETKEAAVNALKGKLSGASDGEICVATYGTSWDSTKTIFGFARYKDDKHSYTIYDSEESSTEIANEIAKLDATARGESTDQRVKVEVVEEDGKITTVTTTTSDIASAALLGTTSDTSANATAFGYIAKEASDRATAITNAINALDSSVSATAVNGNQYSVLTGVTETDGKLTGKTEVKLAAVAKTGSASDVSATAITDDSTHVAVTGTNVSDQISSLSQTIKTVEGNSAKYKAQKLTDSEVTALGDSNVKEAYKIVSYVGDEATATKTQVGDTIKIYKDSSLKSAEFVGEKPGTTEGSTVSGQFLKLTYILADGSESVVYVDMSAIVVESEFSNGLQVVDGKVSVKKDTTSEDFLSVGADGVKVSGVQKAINTAIENVVKGVSVNSVDATVSGGKATVTINGNDVAVANNYTKTVYSAPFEEKASHVEAADKVDVAFKKVETTIGSLVDEVLANEEVSSNSIIKLAQAAGTVNEDGEIGYVQKTDANYISKATSVHEATVILDEKITSFASRGLNEVNGSNAISVSTKTSNEQTVSLKLDTQKDNALSVTSNGLYLSNVWDCGEY